MIGLLETYELMKADGIPPRYLYCIHCHHHLGEHKGSEFEGSPFACSGTHWCGCTGFRLYYCDKPKRPTAEQIYEALRCQT